MFGLYLVDVFGNKELLYRDLNISSLWPLLLRSRPRPPVLPSTLPETDKPEGTFYVQNVYDSWVPFPKEKITRLRIIQVLPKTTPNMDNPPVGLPKGAPGKQVLGTVPVKADGSAYFRAPAGVPLLFHALDAKGRAVQMMFSVTYLQPGEVAGCVGCHESAGAALKARLPGTSGQTPSTITPGPEGSKPFSYPRLVQPVLDKHCTRCHNAKAPKKDSGGVFLTGEPRGKYTQSYLELAKRVRFSQWGNRPTPATKPGQYGARASKLTPLLQHRHYEVKLSAGDLERMITWMDTNALFYGTFNPKDQKLQLKGEVIKGPDLE
jgi:cytochrome c553